MKLVRAALCGALLWVLVFFEVSILVSGFGLAPSMLYYLFHYPFLAILTIISCAVYFRKAKSGFKEGVLLGIVFLIIGILLDAIITVPLFVKSYDFFSDSYLWLGILENFVICVIMGLAVPRKRKEY